MNALLFLLFIIAGYLLLLKVRLRKPTVRQFLISVAAAGFVLFVSSVFSFSNLNFSGRLIPFFLVLIISEEVIFRGVLDDLIGLWQVPLYALIMPFVYSTPFFLTLGPVAEELFFRGFLQKRIGVFLTSIVFALLHTGYGSIAEVLGAFIASMVLGWWVKKHDDVAPTIIAHAFYNMLSILSII